MLLQNNRKKFAIEVLMSNGLYLYSLPIHLGGFKGEWVVYCCTCKARAVSGHSEAGARNAEKDSGFTYARAAAGTKRRHIHARGAWYIPSCRSRSPGAPWPHDLALVRHDKYPRGRMYACRISRAGFRLPHPIIFVQRHAFPRGPFFISKKFSTI